MTLDVGLRYPQRLAGIVGISGYVCEPEKLLQELSPVAKQQRLLITHGTLDTMVPFAKSRPQMKLLEDAGLNLQFRSFEKAHTIAGEEELDVIREFVRAGYAVVGAITGIRGGFLQVTVAAEAQRPHPLETLRGVPPRLPQNFNYSGK